MTYFGVCYIGRKNLGIAPHTVETIVPRYLVRFRPKGEFSVRAV